MTMFSTPISQRSKADEESVKVGLCPDCLGDLLQVIEDGMPMKFCVICKIVFWNGDVSQTGEGKIRR